MNQVGHMSFEGTIVCGCRWVIQEYRVGEVREIGKGFRVVWEPRSYHPRAWACRNLLCWLFNRTLGEECACFHLPLLQCLLCPLSWGSLHWKEGMQLLPQFRCLAFLISLGFCRIITAVEDIRMWFPDVWEGTGGWNDIGWEGAGVL